MVMIKFDRTQTEALRIAALAERRSVVGFVRAVVEQALVERRLLPLAVAKAGESNHVERAASERVEM